jgi:hypothetical protein
MPLGSGSPTKLLTHSRVGASVMMASKMYAQPLWKLRGHNTLLVEMRYSSCTIILLKFGYLFLSYQLVRVREKSKDVRLGKPQAKHKVSRSNLTWSLSSRFINQPPKPKAVKVTAKKHTEYDRQESVDSKPFARVCPNISQQCLDDPRWTRVFLPTLTHALYISENPFTEWTSDSSTFLQTVQMSFELSFMNISYQLSQQDTIVKAVHLV